MKKIVGFIPTTTKIIGFGTVIYTDDDHELYFHVLDGVSKKIIDFEILEGTPVKMSFLPTQFHKSIDIGSLAVFVINGQHEIFIGDCDDLKPYYEVIANKSKKDFIKELNAIFEI